MRKKCAVVLGMFGLVAIISGCGAQNNNQSNDNQAESYDIYVDVDFDSNILFNTYDVNVFIDEEEIGYIEHGEYYTYETSILEGTHSIRFCKSGDSSVYGEASFEITDDSTLKCSIAAEGDSVNILSCILTSGIEENSVVLEDTTGMELDKAVSLYENAGLENVEYEAEGSDFIWVESNWVVVSQTPEAGTQVDKADHVLLTCIKIDSYLNNCLSGLSVADATVEANEIGYEKIKYENMESYEDITSYVEALSDEEKEELIVESVYDSSSDEKIITFEIRDFETIDSVDDEAHSDIENLKGKSVYKAIKVAEKYGYTPVFRNAVTKSDFSVYSLEYDFTKKELKECLITKIKSIDEDNKEIVFLFKTGYQIESEDEKKSTEATLESKLGATYAWGAVMTYGENAYPYGFKLNIATEMYAETAVDEDTWFLKAGCTVENAYGNKVDATCEARVTGTSDNPEVIYFNVY